MRSGSSRYSCVEEAREIRSGWGSGSHTVASSREDGHDAPRPRVVGARVAVAAVHGGRMREADPRPAAGTRVLQRARMITTALAELDAAPAPSASGQS